MSKSLSENYFKLNKWVYRWFSRKTEVVPDQKVAWVSSFVPIEILEVCNVSYVYPESYAAVIAASCKGQECLSVADKTGLSLDCCSYSTCFNGFLSGAVKGPRGVPPKPDLLIVSNNQCTTLLNWWNLLAAQFKVPLYVLDYQGATNNREYVKAQHQKLFADLGGFDENSLNAAIDISTHNVTLWKECLNLYSERDWSSSTLFDYVAPLILARCRTETTDCFSAALDDLKETTKRSDTKRIYWVGYPFWYHQDRCVIPKGGQIVGANYVTWWNLNYSGEDIWERLYNAYNFTTFNQPHELQRKRMLSELERTKAEGVIINRNKSCKRDHVLFFENECPLPCVVIESDMIDSNYFDYIREAGKIDVLMSVL